MIVTGILLAMQYTANTEIAFDSVERIMRDVNNGFLIHTHEWCLDVLYHSLHSYFQRALLWFIKHPREIL